MSVVLPCLNEADSVGTCVRDALERLEAADLDGEVVVCDNASTDGSPEKARQAGARVVHEPRRGYGSALAAAINNARGEYIVMADADGSYDLGALHLMIAELEAGADLVMGNRFRGHIAPGAMPFLHRYVGNPLLTALLSLFFAINVGDVHCGMRAFTREAYRRMALRTTGMEFASEMVARAARLGLHIAQVPVDYHPRVGRSKLRRYRDGWRHLRFLLMYSPTWFYIIPSAAMAAIGFGLLCSLVFFPKELRDPLRDSYLAAFASLLSVLATQIAWLGLSARTLAVTHGFDPDDRFIRNFYRGFTLERGLLIAAAFILCGGFILGWIVWLWASAGSMSLDAMTPLLFAATLIIIGVQAAFSAFFLSLLGVETRVSARVDRQEGA